MSREAMKLALEALESGKNHGVAIDVLRRALAEPQEKYIYGTPLLDAMTGKANEALDKMAENARELGLDYEPAQQGPVAWMYPSDYEKCLTSEHVAEVTSIECTSLRTGEKTTIPLYTSPQPSKPWVDLTDEQIDDIYQGAGKNDLKRARQVIAAFKEKNT